MKGRKSIILGFNTMCIVLVMSVSQLQAQDDNKLAFFADVMLNASEGEHRILAADSFEVYFRKAVLQESSFNKSFKDLKWISTQISEDQSFRIFTWQVKKAEDDYVYKGLIQMSDGQIIDLTDQSSEVYNPVTETLDAENWYGAYYYAMKKSGTPESPYYLLFGYNGFSQFERVKIVDVLHFEGDRPVFGKNVFLGKDMETTKRIYLRYFAEANVNCNFNPESNAIVHDFLVARVTTPDGKAIARVPDGTYVIYTESKEGWTRKDLIEVEAPQNVNAGQPRNVNTRDQDPLRMKKERSRK